MIIGSASLGDRICPPRLTHFQNIRKLKKKKTKAELWVVINQVVHHRILALCWSATSAAAQVYSETSPIHRGQAEKEGRDGSLQIGGWQV